MEAKFEIINSDENYIFKMKYENIEIGICPVMYGYRIRAGKENCGWCDLDYCAGAEQSYVQLIFNLVINSLRKRINQVGVYRCFEEFLIQKIKPMFNDVVCFDALLKMTSGIELEVIELPILHPLKLEWLRQIIKET